MRPVLGITSLVRCAEDQTVRRQNIWHKWLRKLAERWPHTVALLPVTDRA